MREAIRLASFWWSTWWENMAKNEPDAGVKYLLTDKRGDSHLIQTTSGHLQWKSWDDEVSAIISDQGGWRRGIRTVNPAQFPRLMQKIWFLWRSGLIGRGSLQHG